MIIYIHGLGGSGQGVKASIFRKHFSSDSFYAPSISTVPNLAISTLEDIIEILQNRYKIRVGLIGSSLGGYYALYLSNKYKIRSVLINPSIQPTITLDSQMIEGVNFYDSSGFEWNRRHLEMLKKYEVKDINTNLHLLLTQKGDELLDYRKGVEKLKGAQSIIEEGGSHSFDGIERHFGVIEEFLLK